MIKNLEVKGLNDRFDYQLPINQDSFNEDLNIFTGRNGTGKTTLLKLMWYLISGNLHRIISEIPFQSVSIKTDQFCLCIKFIKDENSFSLNWRIGKKESESTQVDKQGFPQDQAILDLNREIASMSRNSLFFPTFRRIEGNYSHSAELAEAAAEDSAVLRLLSSATEMLHEAMSRFSSQVSTDRHKFISSISTKDLEELLPLRRAAISDQVDKLYAELSHKLNQEIPDNDVDNIKDANFRFKRIREEYSAVASKRKELHNPLEVLDLFVDTIFQGRRIQVTQEIMLGKGSDEDKIISSDKLSAGQQQMLSFLCYNAFSDNTTIFIDEPELSLHINWQRYLPRILMQQGTTNQFFIATHAPTIFAHYPESEIRLSEDRGEIDEKPHVE